MHEVIDTDKVLKELEEEYRVRLEPDLLKAGFSKEEIQKLKMHDMAEFILDVLNEKS